MSQSPDFNQNRVDVVYDVLKDKEATHIHATDESDRSLAAEYMLRTYVTNASTAEAKSEKERGSRITRAMGNRGYLLAYLKEGPETELRNMMEARGWSQTQPLDDVAQKLTRFYATLFHVPRDPTVTPSDMVIAADKAGLPRLEISRVDHKNLDETIFGLIEDESIPPQYGGFLRVVFEQAKLPEGTNESVEAAMRRNVAAMLKGHIIQRGDNPFPEELQDGHRYLQAITRGNTLSSIIRTEKSTGLVHDDAEVTSAIAKALELLYRTRPGGKRAS